MRSLMLRWAEFRFCQFGSSDFRAVSIWLLTSFSCLARSSFRIVGVTGSPREDGLSFHFQIATSLEFVALTPAAAMDWPSGLIATALIRGESYRTVLVCSPVSEFQIRTYWSYPAEASRRPSGLNVTARTALRRSRMSPVKRSVASRIGKHSHCHADPPEPLQALRSRVLLRHRNQTEPADR